MSLDPQKYIETIVNFEQEQEKEIQNLKEKLKKDLEIYEKEYQKKLEDEINKYKEFLGRKLEEELKNYKIEIEKEFENKIKNFESLLKKIEFKLDTIVEKLKEKISNLWQ